MATSTERERSWAELCAREPRLRAVMADALRAHRPGRAADYGVWSGIKVRLSALVGWDAGTHDADLTDSAAYDVAYRTCLDAFETGEAAP